MCLITLVCFYYLIITVFKDKIKYVHNIKFWLQILNFLSSKLQMDAWYLVCRVDIWFYLAFYLHYFKYNLLWKIIMKCPQLTVNAQAQHTTNKCVKQSVLKGDHLVDVSCSKFNCLLVDIVLLCMFSCRNVWYLSKSKLFSWFWIH